MGKTSRLERPPGRGAAGLADDPVPAAVRELIRRAQPAGPSPGADPLARQLLLDVEVDGVRCTLVRLPPARADGDEVVLSPREQEIARMVARGFGNKTIAAVLDISTWTVGTYIRRIFAKLHVGTRAAMVAKLRTVGDDDPYAGPAGRRLPVPPRPAARGPER